MTANTQDKFVEVSYRLNIVTWRTHVAQILTFVLLSMLVTAGVALYASNVIPVSQTVFILAIVSVAVLTMLANVLILAVQKRALAKVLADAGITKN